jgi:peptidoglycan/xylan/chitin deacetylase (PgdA/CDA1 family)
MFLNFTKTVARNALYYTGALGLFHRLRNRHTLTTFMFHRVLPTGSKEFDLAEREFTFSVEGFGRCLDFINKHYHVVTLADLQKSLQGGAPLPNNAALITFDDGWRDTLQHAQPELKRRHMTAVLFIATEVLSLKNNRWWQDALVAVLRDQDARRLLVNALQHLAPAENNRSKSNDRQLTAELATMTETARFELLNQVLALENSARQMLTPNDLQCFEKDCFEFGAHGHTHAPLPYIAAAAIELAQSYQYMRSMDATPITMSFPHGAYDDSLVEAAKGIGYKFVFTSEPTLTSTANNTLPRLATIGRIHVPENQWTCTNNEVSAPMLATFLFFRQIKKAICQQE